MKKKILLFILLLIPFIVFAKENEVKITSVEQVDLSNGTTELSKSTYNGLEVNLNLRFTEVGDLAKYKVTIENTTSEDYELSDKIIELNSDYISYNASFEDNTNIIKSNSSKVLYVTISYDKEVEEDKYINSKYTEGNSIVINLANKEDKNEVKTNPDTGIRFSLIISSIGLLTGIIALLVIKKEKTSKTMMLLLITLLLIPITINAASKLFIKVNANIEIVKTYQVSYYKRNIHSYFTDEEMEYYTLHTENCNNVIYIGSVSEENKYTLCEGEVIWTDPERYQEGNTVSFKGIPVRHIVNDGDYCEDLDNYTLCDDNVEVYNGNSSDQEVHYMERMMNVMEYTYNENDPEIMGFDTYYLESDGYSYKFFPNTFTMPNHNVIFMYTHKT